MVTWGTSKDSMLKVYLSGSLCYLPGLNTL